jgi:hypothetical protein
VPSALDADKIVGEQKANVKDVHFRSKGRDGEKNASTVAQNRSVVHQADGVSIDTEATLRLAMGLRGNPVLPFQFLFTESWNRVTANARKKAVNRRLLRNLRSSWTGASSIHEQSIVSRAES